jgi:hypothetical protein
VTVTALTWAVECYLPAIDRRAVELSGDRAVVAAAELRGQGDRVDYIGALLVPGDEVVFYLFAAGSEGAVREVSARAGIEFERVLESIPIGVEFAAGSPTAEVNGGDS